jgi:hypothetical protein
MEEIQYSINCLRRQNFESRYYISERGLYQALSEVNIRKALQHATVLEAYELEDLVKFVMKGARKILGVLILIGHVAYIKDFVGADQFQSSPLDHRLPFELQKLNSLLRPLHAQLFHEKQWEVISPVFSESVLRRQLEDQTILPFSAEKIIGRGGFGTVYKVELDAEQNMYSHDSSAVSKVEVI